MSKKYSPQLSIFDGVHRQAKVNQFDKLPFINALVRWEEFREELLEASGRNREYDQGGRPSYDVVKMFKILLLQRLYNLSDEGLEFRLNDSFSFQRFVGIESQETVPDAKTIWLFRERIAKSGAAERLFELFNRQLARQGFRAEKGTIVDASVVQVPVKGIGSKDDYQEIKEGKLPKMTEMQKRQFDADARFTRKNGKYLYGYKNHINVDVKYKLIRECSVTDASVNESLIIGELLNKKNCSPRVFADACYDTVAARKAVKRYGLIAEIQKQRRSASMPKDKYTKYNSKRSRIRKRIEHVFGHQFISMRASVIRCVGKIRASTTIILNNLVYNMSRLRFLAQECA